MTTPTDVRRYSVRKTFEPDPTEVIPFGRVRTTGHPVGLVVVVGVLVMGLLALPEARWFLAGASLLGCAWGFFLWLHHR